MHVILCKMLQVGSILTHRCQEKMPTFADNNSKHNSLIIAWKSWLNFHVCSINNVPAMDQMEPWGRREVKWSWHVSYVSSTLRMTHKLLRRHRNVTQWAKNTLGCEKLRHGAHTNVTQCNIWIKRNSANPTIRDISKNKLRSAAKYVVLRKITPRYEKNID